MSGEPPSRCCEEPAELKNTSALEQCHLLEETDEHGDRSRGHVSPPWSWGSLVKL